MVRDPVDRQEDIEREIEEAADEIELSTLLVLAYSLKRAKTRSMSEAYASFPADFARIDSIMAKGRKNLKAIADKAMDDLADGNDRWALEYYKAAGKEQVSIKEHPLMSARLEAAKKEAHKAIDSSVRTKVMGLMTKTQGGVSVVPLRSEYMASVAHAVTSMASGVENYTQAIKRNVKTLSKYGLRVYYESGVTRELYAAVRTNIMDTYRTALSDLRMMQGNEFGADGVEVSAHVPCATDHDPYQGRRFYNDAWDNLQASLSRQFVYGANCRHVTYPVIMGIGKGQYSQSELAEMRRQSRESVSFDGVHNISANGNVYGGASHTMSRYDASQYARGIERSLRGMRKEAAMLDSAGLDASMAQAMIKLRTTDYRRVCKAAGITTQLERTAA